MSELITKLKRKRIKTTSQNGNVHFWDIVEPTIYEFNEIDESLKGNYDYSELGRFISDLSTRIIDSYLLLWHRPYPTPTEFTPAEVDLDERTQIIKALADVAFSDVLAGTEPARELPVSDYPLLQELDIVATRYGQNPLMLCKEISYRQLHYLYQIAQNREADLLELKAILAGRPYKRPIPRVTLKDVRMAMGGTTKGMSAREKAEFFSKQRRAEGREAGKA